MDQNSVTSRTESSVSSPSAFSNAGPAGVNPSAPIVSSAPQGAPTFTTPINFTGNAPNPFQQRDERDQYLPGNAIGAFDRVREKRKTVKASRAEKRAERRQARKDKPRNGPAAGRPKGHSRSPSPAKPPPSRKRELEGSSKRKVADLPFKFSPVGLQHIAKAIGDPEVKVINGSLSHSHPICAYERTMCFRYFWDSFRDQHDTIAVIGGNPRSKDQALVNVHLILNDGSPKNDMRVTEYRNAGTTAHPVQVVTPDELALFPETSELSINRYLFIHQLFEAPVNTVIDMIQSTKTRTVDIKFYAIVMPLKPGVACGEVKWSYTDVKGTLKMLIKVDGSGTAYESFPQSMLASGYAYGTGECEGLALTYEQRYEFGFTQLIQLYVVNAERPTAPLSTIMRSPDQYPERRFKVPIRTGSIGSADVITTIHGFFSPSDHVLVPTALVAEVAKYIAGKKRDQDTYTQAMKDAKIKAKMIGLDAETTAMALPLAVALGYCYVESEIAALEIVNSNAIKLDVLNNMKIDIFRRARFLRIMNWGFIITFFAGMFGAAYLRLKGKTNLSLLSFGLAVLAAAAFAYKRPVSFSFQRASFTLPMFLVAIKRILNAFANRKSRQVIEELITSAGGWRWPSTDPKWTTTDGVVMDDDMVYTCINSTESLCMDGQPLAELEDTSSYQIAEVVCKSTHGSTQVGWSVACVRPNVARCCTHNGIVALVNRCLFKMDPITLPWVEGNSVERFVEDCVWSAWSNLDSPPVELRFMSLRQWARRFPAAARIKIYLGHEEATASGYDLEYLNRLRIRKTFIKREKVIGGWNGVTALYDPRLIQGATDQWQAATGPHIYSIYGWFKRVLRVNVDFPPVFIMGPGHTGEELGAWFSSTIRYFLERGDEIIFIDLDEGRWDATLGEQALSTERSIYECLFGEYEEVQRLIALLKIEDRTIGIFQKDGLFYVVLWRRKSGSSNTTLGNTLLNGYACYRSWTLTDDPIPIDGYRAALAGDDNLTVASAAYKDAFEDKVKYLKQLGLRPKMHITRSPYVTEFCSGRFYPVNEKPYFVHGPKIGRILARTGYTHQELPYGSHYAWLRAVVLGLEKQTSFIPILRSLIKRMIELTEGIVCLPIVEEEHKYYVKGDFTMSDDAYQFMEDVYDISKDEVLHLEKWMLSIRHPTVVFENDLIRRLVEVDCPNKDDENAHPRGFTTANLATALWILVACGTTYLLFHFGLALGFSIADARVVKKRMSSMEIEMSDLSRLKLIESRRPFWNRFKDWFKSLGKEARSNTYFILSRFLVNVASPRTKERAIMLSSLIGAPIVEELAKRYHWSLYLAIMLIECIAHSVSYEPLPKIVACVFIHTLCYISPLPLAIFNHMMWNAGVLLRDGYFDFHRWGRAARWTLWSVSTTIAENATAGSVVGTILKLFSGSGAPAKTSQGVFSSMQKSKSVKQPNLPTNAIVQYSSALSQAKMSRTDRRALRRKLRREAAASIRNAMGQISQNADVVVGGDRDSLRTLRNRVEGTKNIRLERLTYLQSLVHPERFTSLIPDMTTFPRALEQIRTVGRWAPDLNGNGCLFVTSSLNNFAEVVGDSTMTIDGISYTNSTFSIHNYTSWETNVGSFRLVSMSVTVKYIGTALNNKGSIAIACVPPVFDATDYPTTYEEVAEYNYSYWGAARDGARQIWMPASTSDFEIKEVDAPPSTVDYPSIVVAYTGTDASALPVPEPQFTVEIVQNIEAFSTFQIITAPKYGARSDPKAMSIALNTVSAAHAGKRTSGPASSDSSIYKGIMDIVPKVAGFMWENKTPILEGLGALGAALF